MVDVECEHCAHHFSAAAADITGAHRVLCGDSASPEDVAQLMDGEEASLVFTSFPYAVGLDYGDSYQDDIAHLRHLLAAVPAAWMPVITEGGYFVTNFGDVASARHIIGTEEVTEYPMAVEYWPAFSGAGYTLSTRRIWAKPHARVSAPWTASSNRAANDWEHLYTWKKAGKGMNERRDPSYFGVWDSSKLEGVDVGKETHPAGFPVGIPKLMIEVYTNRGDIVADPFLGTGTTLIAAEATGRRCVGLEISPAYCDVIAQRFADFTGRSVVRA